MPHAKSASTKRSTPSPVRLSLLDRAAALLDVPQLTPSLFGLPAVEAMPLDGALEVHLRLTDTLSAIPVALPLGCNTGNSDEESRENGEGEQASQES